MTCALTSIIVPVTARGCSPASGKPGLLADASAAGAWLLDAGSADSPGPGGAPLAALPGLAAAGPGPAANPRPAAPGFPFGPAAGARSAPRWPRRPHQRSGHSTPGARLGPASTLP